MSILNLNNIYKFLTGKGNEVKELSDNDLIAVGKKSRSEFLVKGLRFKDLKNAILKSIPSSAGTIPEVKEQITTISADDLKGLTTWDGSNIITVNDPESEYPYDIHIAVEYIYGGVDFDVNGASATIGTGSGTVVTIPDTIFNQNYGGVYGVHLPIGPGNFPEWVDVGADTHVYFRLSFPGVWLNGTGSIKIIATYRTRTFNG